MKSQLNSWATTTAFSPAVEVRPEVREARRVIVKIGTSVLVNGSGTLEQERIQNIVSTVGASRNSGRDMVLVSSGAVGLGRVMLANDSSQNQTLGAVAAIGQMKLSALFHRAFSGHGHTVAQILLDRVLLEDEGRTGVLQVTLQALLEEGAIPFLNENDAVTSGCQFSSLPDNDHLASLLAIEMEANLLILLTDVEGVLDFSQEGTAADQVISELSLDRDLTFRRNDSGAPGRGGMESKVAAAFEAARGGCSVVIANGTRPGILSHILAGEKVGTFISAEV